jgi:hypothetical protein
MFTIQSSASSSFDERAPDPAPLRRGSRASRPESPVGIQSGMPFGASFWKKNLPCQPSGSASS